MADMDEIRDCRCEYCEPDHIENKLQREVKSLRSQIEEKDRVHIECIKDYVEKLALRDAQIGEMKTKFDGINIALEEWFHDATNKKSNFDYAYAIKKIVDDALSSSGSEFMNKLVKVKELLENKERNHWEIIAKALAILSEMGVR